MGANNGKQCGSEGKGSSSISSDVSSSTDHTPTKAQKNAATSEEPARASRFLPRPPLGLEASRSTATVTQGADLLIQLLP
ncbi:F-box/LRR-repeat protein 7-like isoform X8 [Alligator sinensis]|uniref:F-box/LRR-repeat protein 7-like isoform X8 n=1 Tax=Alligator sinensis TaxID=38654 RepID=A0A3Q0FRX0_ALLSI|nr:F-box/LRR-repeat protein 7-like isoform X8 [Alligator sinensis]